MSCACDSSCGTCTSAAHVGVCTLSFSSVSSPLFKSCLVFSSRSCPLLCTLCACAVLLHYYLSFVCYLAARRSICLSACVSVLLVLSRVPLFLLPRCLWLLSNSLPLLLSLSLSVLLTRVMVCWCGESNEPLCLCTAGEAEMPCREIHVCGDV